MNEVSIENLIDLQKKNGPNLTRFQEIIAKSPLKIRLFITLQMSDYDNWKDGTYSGDTLELSRKVNHLIDLVEKWMIDGQPQGFEKFRKDETLIDWKEGNEEIKN